MTITKVDDFNRADGAIGNSPIGSPYDGSGTWDISGDAAAPPGGSFDTLVYDTGAADVDLSVTSVDAPGGNNHGLAIRWTNPSNWWRVVVDQAGGGHLYLQVNIGGSLSNVDDIGISYSTGKVIRCVVTGNVYEVYWDGTLQFTYTDTGNNFLGVTSHGAHANLTGARLDDLTWTYAVVPRFSGLLTLAGGFAGTVGAAPPPQLITLGPAISGPTGGDIKVDLSGVDRSTGLVAKLFRYPDYRTPVAVLSGCRARTGQTRLSDIGSGAMTISNTHPDRATVEMDDLVRFELDGEAIHSWFVNEAKSATKTSDDNTPVSQETVYTGPDVLGVLGEGLVWPSRGPDQLPAEDDRLFSWPSPQYNDAWWASATEYMDFAEANAGGWPIEIGTAETDGFPTTTAGVIGPAVGSPTNAPGGDWYVRKTFTNGTGFTGRYNFYIVADNAMDFYLDGQRFGNSVDLSGITVISLDLSPGDHNIAIHINNRQPAPDAPPDALNPTCVVVAVWTADASNKPIALVLTTDSSWSILAYPPTAPGMTPGQAMTISLGENQTRGLLPGVVLSFDEETDTNGAPWPIVGDISTKVGYDLESFWCKELGQEYVDLRCAPGALVIDAFVIGTAGSVRDATFQTPTDRTDPKSGQLTELAHDRTSKVASMVLIRHLGGWHFMDATGDGERPKIKAIGLGTPPSIAQVEFVGTVELELYKRIRTAITAGYRAHTTAELPQHVAWVADRITIPDWDGTPIVEQIISWSFVEDEHGTIVWSPEIGDLLLDADQRAANALDKMANGTISGDSLVAQPISTVVATGPTCCPPQPSGGG